MYQQYRRQKKSTSSPWAKIVAIIFILGVLGGWLWYLSKIWEKVEQAETQTLEQKPTSITDSWFVSKKISLQWNVSNVPNEIAYTHTITLENGEVIKAFSSSRDITAYNWSVFVQATVAKFDWKEYIIDINAIGTSEEDLETISLPTSTTTRILPNIWLKIDLNNRSDITYSYDAGKIILSVEGFSWTVKIEWFRCESWFPEKDCDAIEKWFTEGSFVGAGGMTYSKNVEGNWFAKNSGGAGYRIITEWDALLYKVSSILLPINESYIKTLLPQAQKLCTSIGTATSTKVTKETLSSWKLTLIGKNNGVDTTCDVRITIKEEWESIAVEKQSKNITTTTNTTTLLPTNTWTVAPVITNTGLVFTSTRWWYSIIYPSAKITYNGTNIQENLWIEKLNCYIRIDVKEYKDRNDDTIWPAISIYECTSKEASDTLANKASWYIFKTNTDGTKLFFIKVQNSAWSEFASKIQIQ